MPLFPQAPGEPQDRLIIRLFRANALLRLVLLAYAVIFGGVAVVNGDPPLPVWGTLAVLATWSAFSTWWYWNPRGSRSLILADHVVTLAVLFGWHYLAPQCPIFATVPISWSVAAPLTVAILGGPVAGLFGGAVVGAAAVFAIPNLNAAAWALAASILMTSVGVGYLVDMVRRSLVEREAAAASALAMVERQRLARAIHDGALQVLALVEREGASLGPRGAQLAREAREQERALRSLLRGADLAWDDAVFTTERDLTDVLDRHAGETVTVSAMADAIPISKDVADEVDAAVSEALSNVTRHAGPDARVWILLEQVADEAIISIRDNGVGADPASIRSAGDRGRLGVRHSIVGRIGDVGGSVRLRSSPGKGLEWEFRIPCGSMKAVE